MFFVNSHFHESFRFFRPFDYAESPPAAGAHRKITSHGNNSLRLLLPCEVIFL